MIQGQQEVLDPKDLKVTKETRDLKVIQAHKDPKE